MINILKEKLEKCKAEATFYNEQLVKVVGKVDILTELIKEEEERQRERETESGATMGEMAAAI